MNRHENRFEYIEWARAVLGPGRATGNGKKSENEADRDREIENGTEKGVEVKNESDQKIERGQDHVTERDPDPRTEDRNRKKKE